MSTVPQPPIRAGAVVDDAHVRRIFDGVRACALPRPEWTHPAHLVFATALLDGCGLAAAEDAAPGLIRAYNASVGGVNDDTQGYHHTITLFFLRRIDRFLAPFTVENLGVRATRLLASPLSAPDYVLGYYSKERLFTIAARRDWVEPDLKSLAQQGHAVTDED